MMGRVFISHIKNSRGRQSRQVCQPHGHQGPVLLHVCPATLRVWLLSLWFYAITTGPWRRGGRRAYFLFLEAFWKFHVTLVYIELSIDLTY